METIIFVAIMGAFAIGVSFGVLAMSLLAIASLGEDELPQIHAPRQYQD